MPEKQPSARGPHVVSREGACESEAEASPEYRGAGLRRLPISISVIVRSVLVSWALRLSANWGTMWPSYSGELGLFASGPASDVR